MIKILVFILLACIGATTLADELSIELGNMCQKLKTCSLEKVEASQQLSPEMKKQMEAMFDKTCAGMEQNYKSGISAFPQHYKSALACVKSMANASCEQVMDRKQKSKECKEYEALTAKGM